MHDVAAHAGSLAAVLFYFRVDLAAALCAPWRAPGDPGARLRLLLLIGTLPAVFAGLLLHELAATVFRSPLVVATTTITFGLLLWWADRHGARRRTLDSLGWRDALLIGVAQCLALVPGTSRSGITMTAGLLLGLDRGGAARFSFLLSAPTILLAVAWEGRYLLLQPHAVDWQALAVTTLFSALFALLAIHYFLRFLERFGLLPYVIYRLLLGSVLFSIYL